MSNVAKDEAELLDQVVLATCECQPGGCYLKDGAILCCAEDDKVEAVFAAIRAAGWAVVPVALMEEAASVLEDVIIQGCEEELPIAIRAMLEAAPGVKP